MSFSGIFGAMNGIIPLLGPFMREHEKRLYSPLIFFLISTLYHLPVQLFLCLLFQVLFFWVADIQHGFEAFAKYYIMIFATYFTGAGFGDVLSIIFRKIQIIVAMFPVFIAPFFMISGFISNVKDMVFYLIGYSYLSIFRFGFQAGILIEFDTARAQEFATTCKVMPDGCSNDSCAIQLTNNSSCDPFSIYDFYEDTYWWNIAFIFLQAIIYKIISAIIFYKYISDKPIPYEELPPTDSFRNPNMKGKLFQLPGRVTAYSGNKNNASNSSENPPKVPLNKVSPFTARDNSLGFNGEVSGIATNQ